MKLLVVLAVLMGGCVSADLAQYAEQSRVANAEVAVRPSALSPGDVFEVRVYNEKALSGLFRVSPEGTIDFPLIGRVAVQGMSPNDVAESLSERLKDGYLREPFVTVYVQEYNSRKVFVLGQVNKPGTFGYQDNMNIVQAITLAGGFTNQAAKDQCVVTRQKDGKEVRIEVPVERISLGQAPNLELVPGDIVFVPETVL